MSNVNKNKVIEGIVNFSLLPYAKTHDMELSDLIKLLYDYYNEKTTQLYENKDLEVNLEVNSTHIENIGEEQIISVKKSRGRPKGSKNKVNKNSNLSINELMPVTKRGRGRPPKNSNK